MRCSVDFIWLLVHAKENQFISLHTGKFASDFFAISNANYIVCTTEFGPQTDLCSLLAFA